MDQLFSILLLLTTITCSYSLNILAVTPYPSVSHTIPFIPLLQSISTAHNVTLITSNPSGIHPSYNLRVIDVSDVYALQLPTTRIESFTGYTINKHHEVFRFVIQLPEVREVLFDDSFDLVIADATSPIWSSLGVRYACPVLGLLPHEVYAIEMRMGSLSSPNVNGDINYVANWNMSIADKLLTLYMGITLWAYSLVSMDMGVNHYLKEYFPHVQDLDVSTKPFAMIFLNLLPGFHPPRATFDNVKYIAGGAKYNTSRIASLKPVQNGMVIIYVEFDDDEATSRLMNESKKCDRAVLWVKTPNTTYLDPEINFIEQYVLQEILHQNISVLVTNGNDHDIEWSLQYTIPMIVIPRLNNLRDKHNGEKLVELDLAKLLQFDDLHAFESVVEDVLQHNAEYRKSIANYAIKTRGPLSGWQVATIWMEWLLKNVRELHLNAIESPVLRIDFKEVWYLDLIAVIVNSILIALIILNLFFIKALDIVTYQAAKKELVY